MSTHFHNTILECLKGIHKFNFINNKKVACYNIISKLNLKLEKKKKKHQQQIKKKKTPSPLDTTKLLEMAHIISYDTMTTLSELSIPNIKKTIEE